MTECQGDRPQGSRNNAQVPHLTQNTTWKRNKNTINITNKSQEVSPLPAGDRKAAKHPHKYQ